MSSTTGSFNFQLPKLSNSSALPSASTVAVLQHYNTKRTLPNVTLKFQGPTAHVESGKKSGGSSRKKKMGKHGNTATGLGSANFSNKKQRFTLPRSNSSGDLYDEILKCKVRLKEAQKNFHESNDKDVPSLEDSEDEADNDNIREATQMLKTRDSIISLPPIFEVENEQDFEADDDEPSYFQSERIREILGSEGIKTRPDGLISLHTPKTWQQTTPRYRPNSRSRKVGERSKEKLCQISEQYETWKTEKNIINETKRELADKQNERSQVLAVRKRARSDNSLSAQVASVKARKSRQRMNFV